MTKVVPRFYKVVQLQKRRKLQILCNVCQKYKNRFTVANDIYKDSEPYLAYSVNMVSVLFAAFASFQLP